MTSRRVIALDLGGTQIHAALFVDDQLPRRAALPTDVAGGPTGVFAQISTLTEQVCGSDDSSGIIGVGSPVPDRLIPSAGM